MKLVVDSGGSKTDWNLIIPSKNVAQFHSIGLNPYFQTDTEMTAIVEDSWPDEFAANRVEEVFFYGAGLSSETQKLRIKKMLKIQFEKASLNVEHDLLGAARALSGNQPCIATIMGTGSNSCAYNGRDIIANRPSLGFILGDEGSGAHIGKNLLSFIWNLELDHPLRQNFETEFDLDFNSCLKQLYSGQRPNQYLAQFAPFALKNADNVEVRQFLNSSFSQFFETHVMAYEEHKEWGMNALGSVAKYFEIIWRPLAEERGIQVNKVLASPIETLTEYHLNS